MKKIIGIFICMLLLFTAFSMTVTSETSVGNTIYVDDDASEDWYDETHVRTIQEGVDIALDGDTVFVYSGIYYENVEIDMSIVLQGEDRESTIIDAGGVGDVVFVSADNVEITGFSIINSGPSWMESGIELIGVGQCIVTDNIVNNCFIGINAFITSEVTISMNSVSDNEFGIRLQDSKRDIVTRNNIQDNYRGMYLNGANFNEITENNFINNVRHLDFYGVFLNTINSNYWERLVDIGPKPIFGKLFLLIPIPGFIFDFNPASEPYVFEDEYNNYNEIVYDNPLSFRVEFEKLSDRVWRIKGYATNTFDEEITVRWGCSPCVFAFFYPIPDEGLNLLVGSYRTVFSGLKFSNRWFEFEPGEEKLIDSKLFYGISNNFIYGLSKGYRQYFDSWPILPNGEYEVRASLSPYQNENYEMLSLGVQETITFNYF